MLFFRTNKRITQGCCMDEYDYAAAYDRLSDRQRMDILIVILGIIGLDHAEDTLAIRIIHAINQLKDFHTG
jgi:hypothetical protein